MSELFSELRIKDIVMRNRIIVPPMCQYSAVDGMANDWHLVHYGSMAAGGAGAIILEATAVSPEGRISPYDLGLWSDKQIAPLAKIVSFIESQGSIPAIQIAHAGRKACTDRPWLGGKPLNDWDTIYAPSAIAFSPEHKTPQALTTEEIHSITDKFRDSAKRALNAGFKIVEIHAAHGYLLNQFLSPLANKRTDEYGGSLENRSRFLCEVVSAIKTVWDSKLPISVRISATDWADGGFTAEESVELSKMLRDLGVAIIDCSTGGMIPHAKIPVAPSFQVPYAEKIKKEVDGVFVSTVGVITDAHQAEKIIKKGMADAVMVGRGFLKNRQWATDAAIALNEKPVVPNQYLRAF